VEALDPKRRDEQAEVAGGLDAVGQLELEVAELVGDALQGAAAGLGGAGSSGIPRRGSAIWRRELAGVGIAVRWDAVAS